MRFFQLNFNTIIDEPSYLYKPFKTTLPIGNVTILITVKQNIEEKTNRFFNTIKDSFVQLDGFLYNSFQSSLSQPTYKLLFDEIGNDIFELNKFFSVIDTRKVETENVFSIYFFYNEN